MTARYLVLEGPGSGGPTLRGGALGLWRYRGPEVVVSGPAETGKTTAVLHKLHCLLCKYEKAQAVLVRKVRDTIFSTVLQTYLRRILQEPSGVTAYGGEHPQWFDYPNGSRLWLAGMDDPGKALSSERDFAVVNQAEELTVTDWEVLTTRCTGRAGNAPYGQVLGDCNPGPPWHWIRQRPSLKLLESRHEDNPSLWDGERWTEQGRRTLLALDQLTGVRKERLRYGRWVSAEGTVYEFDARLHVIPREHVPTPSLTFGAVDWGLKNPGVLQVWQTDRDGRMYLVHEVYRTGQLIDWWVQQARAAKLRYNVECFVCDPSEPAYIEAFVRGGMWAVPADNAIRPGIDAVQDRLAVAKDGRPRLVLVADALVSRDETLAELRKPVCTQQEFDAYQWPKAADGRSIKEVPVKENDHGMDACRYACVWLDARQRGGDPSKISSGGGLFSGGRGMESYGPSPFDRTQDARRPPKW